MNRILLSCAGVCIALLLPLKVVAESLPNIVVILTDEYVSGAIGKWHPGLDEDCPELKWHALNRVDKPLSTFEK